MPKFKFGKYADLDYSEAPEDYLEYLIRTNEEQTLLCKAELERRKIKVEDSYMTKIVDAGFQQLASKVHSFESGIDISKLKHARDVLDHAIADAAPTQILNIRTLQMPKKTCSNPYCVIGFELGSHNRTWLKSELEAINHAKKLLSECGNRSMTFAIVRLVAKASC